MKQLTNICLICALMFSLAGCAAQKPQKSWKSSPPVHQAQVDAVQFQLKPLKLDNPFFVAFELTIENASSMVLEIDWNQTRYLHRDQDKGLFVFRGVEPQMIKARTIPNDRILAGEKWTKQIAPARTVAWMPRHQRPSAEGLGYIPGILPSGDNSISLVVLKNGRSSRLNLSVKILVKEISQ